MKTAISKNARALEASIAGVKSHLETLRAQIDSLKAKILEIQGLACSREEFVARLDRAFDREAEKVSVDPHLQLLARGGSLDLFRAYIPPGLSGADGYADLAPLLCNLFGGTLRDRLIELADVSIEFGPSEVERGRKIKTIREQLRELEREEEEVILSAEFEGIDIDRRPDVDPAVFLEWE